MEIRFTQAARKHRVGRASARHVMAHVRPTETITAQGNSAWRYLGVDERGRELDIVAVEVRDDRGGTTLLVIHVMPTHLRGGAPNG